MGKAKNRKWERRQKWPLSKGARLKKVHRTLHQNSIDALTEDALRFAAERKAA